MFRPLFFLFINLHMYVENISKYKNFTTKVSWVSRFKGPTMCFLTRRNGGSRFLIISDKGGRGSQLFCLLLSQGGILCFTYYEKKHSELINAFTDLWQWHVLTQILVSTLFLLSFYYFSYIEIISKCKTSSRIVSLMFLNICQKIYFWHKGRGG